jgi:hypothetical protein
MINESNLTSRIGGGSQISPQLRDRIRQIRAKAPKPKPQTPDEFWAELEAEQRADDEYRKKYGLPTREQEERSRLVDATEAREMFGIPPDNLAQMEARGLIHGCIQRPTSKFFSGRGKNGTLRSLSASCFAPQGHCGPNCIPSRRSIAFWRRRSSRDAQRQFSLRYDSRCQR